MIPGALYYPIYLIVLAVITLLVARQYSFYPSERLEEGEVESPTKSVVLLFAVTLFIGLRPIDGHAFVDMGGYAMDWGAWNEGIFHFSFERENFLFDNLRAFMSTAGMPVEWFFMLIAIIYFGAMWVAVRRVFPNDTLFVFLICLVSFSTFSYGTNGIKAGAAASLFLVALAYHDNLKISIPMAVISWGFHHSMIVVLLAYLCVRIYRNPKAYFALWIFSFLMGMLHITFFQNFFAGFLDDHSAEYLDSEWGSGFRIDFILYSVAPILAGYWVVFKKEIESEEYKVILCLYTFVNALWLLCIYASYTNRLAYLSWFMYPIVLIYPFLKLECGDRQFHTAKQVGYAHLAFTLFMYFIYYGFIHD